MSLAAARTPMELVHLSAGHLKSRGSQSPRLDAEVLVAHALGCRRLDLYLQFERPLGDAEVDAIRELVRRRSIGEPVAYITGSKEFYGRTFKVTRDTLVPRPETELLIEHVLTWVGQSRLDQVRILDLGTGSGCIGVTLAAELPQAEVVATDISEGALEIARENVQRHDVGERVMLASGSWWQAVADGEFDVVVSNPPYISSAEMVSLPRDVGEFEPAIALRGGDDGVDAYGEIAKGLAARRPGLVVLEVDPNRAAEVSSLLAQAQPGLSVSIHKDLAGLDRLVVAK